ncbi:hypothetical protein MMC34_001862 [Xylographa carneopallida]|nr:hypothetical protein [Xylographa carneopallida]
MPERIRLHISPLNPDLLATILPPSLLPKATGISYHSLQTFPERNYGYIELPAMEAANLKKKLNGSILKGSKVRVEEARPEKKTNRSADDDEADDKAETKGKRTAKKLKREEGVLPGYELPKERKVKRGWTDPTASSKKSKVMGVFRDKATKKDKKAMAQPSSFGDGPECLFRSTLPPNVPKSGQTAAAMTKKSKKTVGSKADRGTVVHEFSSTTKYPSFIRDSHASHGSKTALEYVDGKGWVNKHGEVIEAPRAEQRLSQRTRSKKAHVPETRSLENLAIEDKNFGVNQEREVHDSAASDDTSSSGITSPDDNSDGSESIGTANSSHATSMQGVDAVHLGEMNSSAGHLDDGSSDSDATSSSGTSSSSHSNNQDNYPTVSLSSMEAIAEVHPLEALFKRPKFSSSDSFRKPQLEVKTSFSFFNPEDHNSDHPHRLMPQTPFTQRDMQHRSIRSAAPTPDTAAPGKSGFGNLWGREGTEDDEEDDEDMSGGDVEIGTPSASKKHSSDGPANDKPPESDFAKWFWEHRGETNRAWKKRMREAKKEKRQKENKRRARTAV